MLLRLIEVNFKVDIELSFGFKAQKSMSPKNTYVATNMKNWFFSFQWKLSSVGNNFKHWYNNQVCNKQRFLPRSFTFTIPMHPLKVKWISITKMHLHEFFHFFFSMNENALSAFDTKQGNLCSMIIPKMNFQCNVIY